MITILSKREYNLMWTLMIVMRETTILIVEERGGIKGVSNEDDGDDIPQNNNQNQHVSESDESEVDKH